MRLLNKVTLLCTFFCFGLLYSQIAWRIFAYRLTFIGLYELRQNNLFGCFVFEMILKLLKAVFLEFFERLGACLFGLWWFFSRDILYLLPFTLENTLGLAWFLIRPGLLNLTHARQCLIFGLIWCMLAKDMLRYDWFGSRKLFGLL